MQKLVVILSVVVAGCILVKGACSYAAALRCERLVDRITASYREGDLPAAKLLIDQAIVDADEMGFGDRQRRQLEGLQEIIYKAIGFDCLGIAREKIRTTQDGLAALSFIGRAETAAQTIDMGVPWDLPLWSTVYCMASVQVRELAEQAERNQDFEKAARLQLEADDLRQQGLGFQTDAKPEKVISK